MPKVVSGKRDLIWNYVGTITSMASSFVLLPFLILYLTGDELGLWYVYVAISNLSLLFEFGFNPALSRNIVYCMSGVRRLSKQGCDRDSIKEGVDFHLLNNLFRVTKMLYGVIALAVVLLVSTVGSLYIGFISAGADASGHWAAWAVFCAAMFMNLYYLYALTYLRGLGDIASESKAKTVGRLSQLLVSIVLLALGLGLLGAAIGFFVNGAVMRAVALVSFRRHRDVVEGIASDQVRSTREEYRSVFGSVSYVAWRDGLVQFACYGSTQATSVICSLTLSLSETGTFSVLLQFATAVYNLASVFTRSYLPMFQSSFAEGNKQSQVSIVGRSMAVYYGMYFAATIGVLLVAFPLLPVIKPSIEVNVALYLLMALYLFLWNQHSLFCSFIISTNRIPYVAAYVLSAAAGMALSYAFAGWLGMGAIGIVLGQMLSQLAYNNWKWPRFVMRELGTTLPRAMFTEVRRFLRIGV